jgi:hypothetical protein
MASVIGWGMSRLPTTATSSCCQVRQLVRASQSGTAAWPGVKTFLTTQERAEVGDRDNARQQRQADHASHCKRDGCDMFQHFLTPGRRGTCVAHVPVPEHRCLAPHHPPVWHQITAGWRKWPAQKMWLAGAARPPPSGTCPRPWPPWSARRGAVVSTCC